SEIERRMKRRGWAVAFTLIGVVVVGLSLALLMLLLSIQQISRFEGDLARLRENTRTWFMSVGAPAEPAVAFGTRIETPTDAGSGDEPATAKSTFGFSELQDAWTEYLRDPDVPRRERIDRLKGHVKGTAVGTVLDRAVQFIHTNDFNTLVVGLLSRIAVGGVTVLNFAVQLLLGATVFLLILLYLIFLLLDYPKYRETGRTFLPPAYRDGILEFVTEFEIVLRRYFRGQFVIASITGILFAVGFWLIGLPMAVPFGLFIGALNMVPYLQIVALAPATILAILRSIQGDSSLMASFALVLLVFGIVQLIQDGLITPRIMGKAVGLSPVAILLGMFIWGKLLGFLGLLLAIPLTCLGIAYYRRIVLAHKELRIANSE
ncbi:MAG: AI-2E family transporter, partial [Phycisphaerae bacterium]